MARADGGGDRKKKGGWPIPGRSGGLEWLNSTENSPRILIKSVSRVRLRANRTSRPTSPNGRVRLGDAQSAPRAAQWSTSLALRFRTPDVQQSFLIGCGTTCFNQQR